MKPPGIPAFTLLTHQPAALGHSFGIGKMVVMRKGIGSDCLANMGSSSFSNTHTTSGNCIAYTALPTAVFGASQATCSVVNTRVVNQNRNIILQYPLVNNGARVDLTTADNRKVLQYTISKQTIQKGIPLEYIPAGTYSVVFNSQLIG